MKKILLAFAFCFAALSAFSSYAAEPRQAPTQQERARTVYIFHQPIVMLQAKFGLTTPEERVLRIRNTLRNFTEADVREPLSIVPVTRYNQQGRLIVMNGKPVMLLTEGDLDEGDDLTLDQAAQRVLARMEAQRMALRDQYDSGWLALSTVKAAAGLLACWRCCCSATARGDPGAGSGASTVGVLWRIAAGCRKAGGGTLAPLRFGFTPC